MFRLTAFLFPRLSGIGGSGCVPGVKLRRCCALIGGVAYIYCPVMHIPLSAALQHSMKQAERAASHGVATFC